MGRSPIQRVSQEDLRALFNKEVLPRIDRGELLEVVVSAGVLSPRTRQPAGTISQRVAYWGTVEGRLEKVAVVHRYVLPDGTLGASGRPDPKYVEHGGERYAIEKRTPP